MGKKWRYGVIFDAGSSGTRLYVYKWKAPAVAIKGASEADLHHLPHLKLVRSEKIRPGVSSFADKPSQIGPDHLRELIEVALETIPDAKLADTPVYLMATAGMRLLPSSQQANLLQEICGYLRQHTKFHLPDCKAHVQIISGETEGLYGWMATNYLLGGFDRPEEHNHGKGHHTYGFLDMGGASAQIAFAPNRTEAHKHANDLKLVRLRTMDGATVEHRVFTATWLGFGANKAHDRYLESLKEAYDLMETKMILDPCLPKGLRTTWSGDAIDDTYVDNDPILAGQGLFQECLSRTYPLLGKDIPCSDEPCLLNGQHVPAIDFDVNHFVGVSEYWHTTHGVFGGDTKAYDLTTYQKKVTEFCGREWADIESTILRRKKTKAQKAKDAQEACFKASWLINVLHDGIGIPRYGLEKTPEPGLNISQGTVEKVKEKGFLAPFRPVDTIDDIEVSWTLGKMLLYAAGQIPPKGDERPVGFGSNVEGIASDFEPAGSTWQPPKPETDDNDDWGGKAGDFLEDVTEKHTTAIFFVVLVCLLLALWLRKRDRRFRLINRVGSLFCRHRRPGSPRKPGRGFWLTNALFGRSQVAYERVMEEGDADQFELGEVESDENDHSDSSDGSRGSRLFGATAPKVNMERLDDIQAPSAIDRSGLVIRTESRERLVPGVQMLNAGRRSRTGSPTRLKSPLMTPLQDD